MELRRAGSARPSYESPDDDFDDRPSSRWHDWAGAAGAFHDIETARVSLVSTGTLGSWDRRRFRSNVLLDGAGEDDLMGGRVRLGGAVLGLAIALSVATGAWMAWRPLAQWVSGLAGQMAVKPPKIGKPQGPRQALDTLVAKARAQWPDATVGYVQLGASDDRPVRVRLKLIDDPHPNGLSSVWLHPVDGRVLLQRRWSELDPGGRATAWIYPLHTGELGGPWHIAATGLSGLVLFGLGVSGAWLWWRRRR